MVLQSLPHPSVQSVLEDVYADKVGEGLYNHTLRGNVEDEYENEGENEDQDEE